MVITLNKDEIEYYKKVKEEANKGCDVCPCCGESRWLFEKPDNTGLTHEWPRFFYKGVFKRTKYAVDRYQCLTCGSKWESEPYIYELY